MPEETQPSETDEERDDVAEGDSEPDSESSAEVATATAEREARPLLGGSGVSLFGGEIPYRALIAIAIFVAVFTVVLVGLWALLGGIGLALGWIVALVVGALAVWFVSRSAWSEPAR
jgi:hypothetical protein